MFLDIINYYLSIVTSKFEKKSQKPLRVPNKNAQFAKQYERTH